MCLHLGEISEGHLSRSPVEAEAGSPVGALGLHCSAIDRFDLQMWCNNIEEERENISRSGCVAVSMERRFQARLGLGSCQLQVCTMRGTTEFPHPGSAQCS